MTLRRKLGWVAVLYFAEGLPFGVIHHVLPVYCRVHGMSLTEIGLLSSLGLAWTAKVAWAPLVDRFGEWRRWVTACLTLMAAALLVVPAFGASALSLGLVVVLGGFALAGATQDIAIDAYTIGLVEPGEEGDANGVRVTAYRVALIVVGGGLVLLASALPWTAVLHAAAGLSALLALVVWFAPPVRVRAKARAEWLAALRRWVLRRGGAAVFGFVLLYKLGDAAMGPMVKPFWLDRGFGVAEVGLVSTSVGMLATILGALAGGRLTSHWGIFRALLVLGLAQALSNLGYAAVAWGGAAAPATAVATWRDLSLALAEPGRAAVYAASLLESFTGGLGTAAFLSFLMHVCEKEHAAVQYALLSALFALSGNAAGAASGFLATRLGYGNYFLLTFILALPAYALLPAIRGWLHDRKPAAE
jgi:PAT family beta-lactamase induction signal transducer AmpG